MATDHYIRNHEVVLSAAKKYRKQRQLSPDEAIVWEEISDTERQQALYDVKEKENDNSASVGLFILYIVIPVIVLLLIWVEKP